MHWKCDEKWRREGKRRDGDGRRGHRETLKVGPRYQCVCNHQARRLKNAGEMTAVSPGLHIVKQRLKEMLISCKGASKEGELSEEAAVWRPRLELLTPRGQSHVLCAGPCSALIKLRKHRSTDASSAHISSTSYLPPILSFV